MTLENTIRKIINNNAGLLASYSKADGFGTPECQRPRGKFQRLVSPNQDILVDPSTRDMTPADLCPSCASSSSPLCSCLEAYIDFDYYTWYCSAGGFGDVREPPLKQLPGHCPSFESLGVRGQISNYPSLSDNPNGFVLFEYTWFIDSILGRGPAISSTTGDQGPNILGPSGLSSPRSFHGPTNLADWQALFNGTHPLSVFYYNQGVRGVRTPGEKTLIKMLFDARCGISEQATAGACCAPAGDFEGFNCTEVNSQKECKGDFHPGETCRNIRFENCGASDLTIRPDRIRTTELSKALVNALIKNKKLIKNLG